MAEERADQQAGAVGPNAEEAEQAQEAIEQTRGGRGLMSRSELQELDYERLQRELGNLGDWTLEIGEEMRELSPYVERYHALRAELQVIGQYKSLLQSVLRAQRDAK